MVTSIPDRWLTARPVATIPLEFRPEASPETRSMLILEIAITDATTCVQVRAGNLNVVYSLRVPLPVKLQLIGGVGDTTLGGECIYCMHPYSLSF